MCHNESVEKGNRAVERRASSAGLRFMPQSLFLSLILYVVLTISGIQAAMGQTTVRGWVNAAGQPANRVFVGVYETGGRMISFAWTDQNGHFSLTGVLPGKHRLSLEPESELLIPAERPIELQSGVKDPLELKLTLESRISRPHQVVDFIGTAAAASGHSSIPGGQITIKADGLRLGQITLGGAESWELRDVLTPLGTVTVTASDRFGIYRPQEIQIEVYAGETQYSADLVCTFRWWKVSLLALVLALPAVQELVLRRFRKKPKGLEEASTCNS